MQREVREGNPEIISFEIENEGCELFFHGRQSSDALGSERKLSSLTNRPCISTSARIKSLVTFRSLMLQHRLWRLQRASEFLEIPYDSIGEIVTGNPLRSHRCACCRCMQRCPRATPQRFLHHHQPKKEGQRVLQKSEEDLKPPRCWAGWNPEGNIEILPA